MRRPHHTNRTYSKSYSVNSLEHFTGGPALLLLLKEADERLRSKWGVEDELD